MDICIRGDDSPPLLRYISAFSPQVVAVVEQNPLQRTLKRFVSFFPFHPFLSFLSPFIVFGYVYIYMKLCAWPRLLAARVKREIFIWIQPAVRAACFLRFAAGSLLLRHAEENDLTSLTSVSSATVTTNSNKNCVKFIPLIIHFILRRNDTK